jgi:hypothetical protein
MIAEAHCLATPSSRHPWLASLATQPQAMVNEGACRPTHCCHAFRGYRPELLCHMLGVNKGGSVARPDHRHELAQGCCPIITRALLFFLPTMPGPTCSSTVTSSTFTRLRLLFFTTVFCVQADLLFTVKYSPFLFIYC